MAILDSVDWVWVRRHYDDRVSVSDALIGLHETRSVQKFAELALGISDADGNYSANEHRLGPSILYPGQNINAEQRVFDLAGEFMALADARRVPELIAGARVAYLKIGVGSEISCMVNPKVCWVANMRTIWTHLVIKHADSIERADAELGLYREADGSSEMGYQMWAALHAELRVTLTRIGEIGQNSARQHDVAAGDVTYIWADAIAAVLYGAHHG